jgi:hypothetical protein
VNHFFQYLIHSLVFISGLETKGVKADLLKRLQETTDEKKSATAVDEKKEETKEEKKEAEEKEEKKGLSHCFFLSLSLSFFLSFFLIASFLLKQERREPLQK